MAPRRTQFLIGSFLIGGLVLLIGGIMAFGAGSLFQKRQIAVTYFDSSVAGLQVGAAVTFRGVQVGTVTRIALELDAKTFDAKIPVYLEMRSTDLTILNPEAGSGHPADVAELVKRGLRSRLQMQSIVTGQLVVDLDFKPRSEPVLHADPSLGGPPEIPSLPSDLDVLRSTFSDLPLKDTVQAAMSALNNIAAITAELKPALPQIIANLQSASTNISTVTATADKTLKDLGAASTATLQQGTATLKDLDKQVTTTLESVQALSNATTQQINGRGEQAAAALAKLQTVLAKAESIGNDVDGMIGPHAGARADLETTLRNLTAASDSLKALSRELERNPNALLLGNSKQ